MIKKIILLGLLSFSMCLSKAAEEKAATPAISIVANSTTTDIKEKNLTTSIPPHLTNETSTKNETEINPTSTQVTQEPAKPSEATPAHKEEISKPVDNKTTEKEPKAKENSKELAKNSTETKATTEKAATDKPMNDVTGKNATTMKPDMPNSTQAPKSEDKHVLQARGFDGPSFIGGMILTLGLLAIGFMGFKYYKNQTERNYHTL
ncbi:porimin [Danaus plexippus]|uniref:porimin n=1 Tax=Danaus plexippus TaxID=13037 RepID=UPI002AB19DBE|nr:porimin [Danaus plexippus]